MKRYLQVYTGNGKGKTTAALGLIIRSLGFGSSVFLGQFIKKGDYNETKFLKSYKELLQKEQLLDIYQFGSGNFIYGEPSGDEMDLADRGFKICRDAVISGKYDLIVIDEINCAITAGIISVKQALELINLNNRRSEIVFTGRGADKKILDKADLVTEMKEVKHYFNSGVEARSGIEM